MSNALNLSSDFLALLEPDEPRRGCAVLAEYLGRESKHRITMAKTLRKIVLDPLDWYTHECWKRYGPNFFGLDSANAFRLAADDLRYRFENKQLIWIEQIEALETKWVEFQAGVGWGNWCRLEKSMPDARIGRKIKESASLGHVAAHGTAEEKAARWADYLTACIEVARANPRLGLTAIRQTVAENFGVSVKTIQRRTQGLEDILKNP